MAPQGWSSLPADLVNRVADCLLSTNDLRAVCHHWRSVIADQRSNLLDPGFRPTRWIMLDEDKASSGITDGPFLFVNTATGRFLRRRLPLVRDRDGHVFVTSTTDRRPPRSVSVLNPFTGSLLRFAAAAPLPTESRPLLRLTDDVVGCPPTLILVSVGRSWVYWADPQSESFTVDKWHRRDCPASRLPQIAAAGKFAAAVTRESVPGAMNIFDQLRSEEDGDCRCYAVVADGGDMLAVLKRRRGMDVFRIDAVGNVMERVKSIGSQALFLGVRCLVVDTDRFPTVEANCAYFQLTGYGVRRSIYKFNIGDCDNEQEPAFVSAAMAPFRPLTVTQIFSNYTMDIPVPPPLLPLERCTSYTEVKCYISDADCYLEYIDYVDDECSDEGGWTDQLNDADLYDSGSEHDNVDSLNPWYQPDDDVDYWKYQPDYDGYYPF